MLVTLNITIDGAVSDVSGVRETPKLPFFAVCCQCGEIFACEMTDVFDWDGESALYMCEPCSHERYARDKSLHNPDWRPYSSEMPLDFTF